MGALLACVTSTSSCSQSFPPFFASALLTPHGLTRAPGWSVERAEGGRMSRQIWREKVVEQHHSHAMRAQLRRRRRRYRVLSSSTLFSIETKFELLFSLRIRFESFVTKAWWDCVERKYARQHQKGILHQMFVYKTSIINIDKHDNWNTTINPKLLKSFYMTYRSNMTIKYVGNILKIIVSIVLKIWL